MGAYRKGGWNHLLHTFYPIIDDGSDGAIAMEISGPLSGEYGSSSVTLWARDNGGYRLRWRVEISGI